MRVHGIPAPTSRGTSGVGGAGGGNIYFTVDDMIKTAKIYALTAMDICNRKA